MDKKTLARNFSRCASVYDKHANIQRRAASELMEELPRSDFTSILEIGCGTGGYTRLLRERFKYAAITSVDIAEKMVAVARQKLKEKISKLPKFYKADYIFRHRRLISSAIKALCQT